DDDNRQRSREISKGIAYREDFLAHLQAIGIAQREVRELLLRFDLDQREIVPAMAAKDSRLVAGAVGDRDLDFLAAADHVIVGQDLAFGINNETRSDVLF